jgi:proline iminopeptidase
MGGDNARPGRAASRLALMWTRISLLMSLSLAPSVAAASGPDPVAWAVNMMKERQGNYNYTPPFRGSDMEVVPESIAEWKEVVLNGAAQWVMVRGQSVRNPILIWLHGGPGADESQLLRHYDKLLEETFIVVYWIQRGSGRSYSPDLPMNKMRITDFVIDLDHLVSYLLGRFPHHSKVILAGHSWGSMLGAYYAKAHPSRVSAFVGISQLTDMPASEREGYDYCLTEAHKRNNVEATRDLERIGPPPYRTIPDLLRQREWLADLGGSVHTVFPMGGLSWLALDAPEYTWYDLYIYDTGFGFSLENMWREIERQNLFVTHNTFQVPVAIFTGRYDRQVRHRFLVIYLVGTRFEENAKPFPAFLF